MQIWARNQGRVGRLRVLTAAGLALVMPASVVIAPGTARARATVVRPAAPQRQRSVSGHPAVPAKAVTAAAAPAWRAPAVHWPQPATGDVNAPVNGLVAARTDFGGLPVSVWATTATPVHVQVFDQATTAAAGLAGVLLRLSTPAGRMHVSVDYSGFQYAYGGDWATRLRLIRLPDCAATTPGRSGCDTPTPVPSTNSAASHSVDAELATGGVYALAAAASGGAGDYSASSLSPSSAWSVGEQTGNFSWSYPLAVPPVPTEEDLDLKLSYSSQSVDGRTASTNNQTSWVGEGFDLDQGYVQRSYKSCPDAGGPANNGDQCWAGDNATVMLKGQSTELVRDDATGSWHLKDDDGSKVEELTGATNGDKLGQYWRLTTPDGTQYVFGLNHLPGWATGKAVTNSAWTEPVYTKDSTDPCYNASFASSYCTRAWRWNLDYVVDPHGDASSLWYQPETNYYKRGYAASSGATGTLTQYTRGGYLKEIDYGQTATTIYAAATPAKVLFGVAERCLSDATFNCDTAANFTKANAAHWPDVPFDQNCDAGATCATNIGPSLWSRKRLTSITTQVLSGGSYLDVDSWALSQSYPDPGDGTSPALWLDSITRTGHTGGSVALPPMVFGKTQLQNRVDTVGDGLPKLDKYRIGSIDTESGGHLTVTYSAPDCTPTDEPSPATNTRRCYPVYWPGSPPQPKPFLDWFQKYVVTQLVQSDPTGGAPDQVSTYQYLDTPAWHFDDQDGLVKDKYKTWGQYRGYTKVRTLSGDPNGAQTQTDNLFLRGMDGDRSDPDDATKKKSVTVTDSQGLPITDADPLQGFTRETIHYNGVDGAVLDTTGNDPWTRLTATRVKSWGTTTANVIRTGATRTRTALSAGGWRQTETDTAYTNEGLSQQVDDKGDLATTADDQCVRTSYARNDAKGLIDFVSRVESVAVSCAATPNRPDDVIADMRTSYDGQAFGVAATKGDVTRTEQVASYSGSTPVYLTVETKKYDVAGRVTETDDAMGRKTTVAYTPATGGPVTAITQTDNLGYATTTTVEPTRGLAVGKSDANSKITALAYDPLGRLTQVWLPGRSRTANPTTPNMAYAYHIDGAASTAYVSTSTLTPDQTYITGYQFYDGFLRDRQTQAPAPGGGRVLTDTFYDARGLVVRANSNYYNASGPGGTLFVPTDAIPGQTVTSYDGAGRAIQQSLFKDGNHLWDTLTSYGGDRTTVTPPQGGTASTTVTDARGHTVHLLQYKSGSSGAADSTSYTYTPGGDLASVVDATGHNTWSYRYNLLGEKVSETNPDTGTTSYVNDNDGELTATTDARGSTLAYSYDGLGRKTGEYLGSLTGTRLASWAYDSVAKGQPTGATRYVNGLAYSSTVASYDDRYQPTETSTVIPKDPTTSTAQQALAGTYTSYADYNTSTDGSPHRISYPAAGGLGAETLVYGYDSLSQPATVTGIASYVSGTSYSQLGTGAITAETLGTGTAAVTRGYTYEDGTNRLTRVLDQRQATPSTVNDTHYGYDPAGDITSISNTQQDGRTDNQCFRYDYLQRLTDAWTPTGSCQSAPATAALGGPAPYWQSYGFDIVGNLTARTDHAGTGDTSVTGTYPASGALQPHTLTNLVRHTTTGDTSTAYTYDPAGDLTHRISAGTDEVFAWDAEGKLATVTKGSSVTGYLYDADGNQLISSDPTGATLYLDNMEIHASSAGTVSASRYYSFGGAAVAVRTAAGLSWILTDDQNTGQTQISADATQTITRRYQTPFGDARGAAPAAWTGMRGFVGGTNNPSTALVTLGARQYDPTTGRFISHDPVTNSNDPQQLNGYSYADDTPVTKADPSGLMIPCDGGCGPSILDHPPSRCDVMECDPHLHRNSYYGHSDRHFKHAYVQDTLRMVRLLAEQAAKRAAERLREIQRQQAIQSQNRKKHHSIWDRFVSVVNTVAPILTFIALATAWVPVLNVITASVALVADTVSAITNSIEAVNQFSKGNILKGMEATVTAGLTAVSGGLGGRALYALKTLRRVDKVVDATKEAMAAGKSVAGGGISFKSAVTTLSSRAVKMDSKFADFDAFHGSFGALVGVSATARLFAALEGPESE